MGKKGRGGGERRRKGGRRHGFGGWIPLGRERGKKEREDPPMFEVR